MTTLPAVIPPPQSRTGAGNGPAWPLVLAAILVASLIVRRDALTASAGAASRQPAKAAEEGWAEHEPGRGRGATKPTAIPARGWKDIGRRVLRAISDDRVMANAAGVTYYGILALFPALAALVSIFGLFADPATIEGEIGRLSGLLPAEAVNIIGDQLRRISSHGGQTLGITFLTGLALSIWSANAGMKALFDALNIVYGEKEKRNFFKLNAVSLAFTASAILFILVALGGIVVVPAVLNAIGLGGAAEILISVLRWPVMLLIVALGLAVVYRYGPSRQRARWRWISWGSAFAAIMWIVVSMLFSWYTANFGKYNETYGSLGAVVAFMTWMWISATVILIGGEINAEMEHQTARDTTTGAAKPLGARGARMADTVGEAAGR